MVFGAGQEKVRGRQEISTAAIRLPPQRIRQHYRGFNLPRRYLPVPSEQTIFLLRAYQPITVLLVKTDSPRRVGPRSDEHWAVRQSLKVEQQLRSNAAVLTSAPDIGVPNQRDVLNLLSPHHAFYSGAFLAGPERYAIIQFMPQLVPRHIRLRPPVVGNDPLVSASAVVYD